MTTLRTPLGAVLAVGAKASLWATRLGTRWSTKSSLSLLPAAIANSEQPSIRKCALSVIRNRLLPVVERPKNMTSPKWSSWQCRKLKLRGSPELTRVKSRRLSAPKVSNSKTSSLRSRRLAGPAP